MTFFAVIDTNVLVSALLRFDSIPGTILTECLTGKIIPLLSDAILSEYYEVLLRPKFQFSPEAVNTILTGIVQRGIFIDSLPTTQIFPDPKDVVFYEVVMQARRYAPSYLVSGNLKHFPSEPFILSPREMLDLLNQ